jgi:hypothetical protein
MELPDRAEEHRNKFLKFFSSRGSKNQASNDIIIRGMKRPHEMMNPISKLPSSTSAVRRRAEE